MTTAQFPREQNKQGEFVRQDSMFREWVRDDYDASFPAVADRYHLYVSFACPWAHRTMIARRLLGLEAAISMSIVDPVRDDRGWAFRRASSTVDPVNGFAFLAEAYTATDPSFDGRVTVPALWDREKGRIVNNESSEILRMLNGEFRPLARHKKVDLYPDPLRDEIDAVNSMVYDNVNNGVYKAGFASTQPAYEKAVGALFDALDALDRRLATNRYLIGDRLTEADIRLFTTLVRFDAVYVGHFKCNVQRIADYDHLSGYLRDLYQTDGFGETVEFDHIKRHYYVTHTSINPTGIVPVGPALDFRAPHDRTALTH